MSKNNTTILTKTLLQEGELIKKEVIEDIIYLTVKAFNHTYIIKAPYTKSCKITQEN